MVIPPETYWPEIQRICKERDILLVADEVICGFGRCGTWFGFEQFGITPDIAPIAKGLSSGYLPIGGVLISDKVTEAMFEHAGEFSHGYTYSGHPVACAAALANLEIIENENVIDHVRDVAAPKLSREWGSAWETIRWWEKLEQSDCLAHWNWFPIKATDRRNSMIPALLPEFAGILPWITASFPELSEIPWSFLPP